MVDGTGDVSQKMGKEGGVTFSKGPHVGIKPGQPNACPWEKCCVSVNKLICVVYLILYSVIKITFVVKWGYTNED